jgi:hypothetical protein
MEAVTGRDLISAALAELRRIHMEAAERAQQAQRPGSE